MLVKSSRTKVATLPLMPMKRFTLVSTTYAVLGILNTKEAGYMRGVMDHLAGGKAATLGKHLPSLRAFLVILLLEKSLTHKETEGEPAQASWRKIHKTSAGSR